MPEIKVLLPDRFSITLAHLQIFSYRKRKYWILYHDNMLKQKFCFSLHKKTFLPFITDGSESHQILGFELCCFLCLPQPACFFLFSFFLNLFIWVIERMRGRSRGRGREKISSRFPTERRACLRTQSHHPEIMTWAKVKSWRLNQLSHTDAPTMLFFFFQQKSYIIVKGFPVCCISFSDKMFHGTNLTSKFTTWS